MVRDTSSKRRLSPHRPRWIFLQPGNFLAAAAPLSCLTDLAVEILQGEDHGCVTRLTHDAEAQQTIVQNDPTKAVGNIPRSSQAVAGALWVSLNLVLLQQQQQAEMALGRVNICCASKITSMLHFLPFASASCACLLRATGGGPGRPAALGLRALIGTTW